MRLIRLLKKDLAREISTWVDKSLISADQAAAICRLYGIDDASIDGRPVGYRLLIALGYLFIGLAVITLVGANWDNIPRGVRLVGLVAITVGTHGLALRNLLADRVPSAAGLFLLGNLCYGASIILVAQVYHLGERMPDGVFWWALGSLPFGVLLLHPWLMLGSLLLALLWLLLEFSMGFLAAAFPLFIAASLYVLIKGRASALLFLTTVAGIGLFVEASLASAWSGDGRAMELHAEHFPVSVALFVFAWAFSHWLDQRGGAKAQDYGVLLSLWTLRFGLITMLVLSYERPWLELIAADWDHQVSMWSMAVMLLGASLWLGKKSAILPALLPVTAFCALSALWVTLSSNPDDAVYLQIACNVALVAAAVWLIARGVHGGITHYFFLGVATILLVAFMRYIDLIGDYIGGAVLFIVFAAVLLGAARYWKTQQRRDGET